MGHEYVGTVVEVGEAVTTVKPGDFVVGSFCISCVAVLGRGRGFPSGSGAVGAGRVRDLPLRLPLALHDR